MTNLTHPQLNDYNDHWLFKKHGKFIEVVKSVNTQEFWNEISLHGNFPLNFANDNDETIFDWNNITPKFGFNFNYENSTKEIIQFLNASRLSSYNFILIEFEISGPVLKVPTSYFIDNWEDFINANVGMGSVACSPDFKLLLEFTNDHSFFLMSNFEIF